MNISDYVILKNNFIPECEVKNYFCASDLITQTYRTVNTKWGYPDSHHFERPMLVTNVGGLAFEIVPHNKVGYVCDINISEIVDCILDFYINDREAEFQKTLK